ncbi:MAG: PQQ-dependent sugar dehydrogenase, partial [Nitriliruptorales bacterium]
AARAARLAVDLWRAAGDEDAGRRVIVALGNASNPSQAWPDALAAGPLAAYAHRPILLVSRISGVPEATNRALRDFGAEVATIAGGPGAIPDDIADDLDVDSYERVFGQSRFGTATALADAAVAAGGARSTVFAATGAQFPDALAAGAAAYHAGGVLALVNPVDLVDSPETKAWVEENAAAITRIRVAGGPGAVGDEVVGQLGLALGDLTLAVETVASGFDFPLFATGHTSEADRIYVVEKGGAVWIVEDGSRKSTPFLDLRGQVSSGGEQGLLGLAFHPSYPTDPRVYAHYTNQAGNTRVVEYRRATADRVDAASARTLLSLDQPFSNHNGGMLEFGPGGALYASLGDGGSGGDPQGNAQNTGNLLGGLVRIDVGSGSRTLWMHGLRNPWRFSFDAPEGLVYIGDVGQSSWEEVDVAGWNARGTNFGWNVMEGKHCFQPSTGCDRSGLTLPVLEYPLGEGGTCAVTGGYVYRGDAIPELRGQYLYADFCAGFVRSFHYRRGIVSDERDWTSQLGDLGNIPSFGTDANGEILITSTNGTVYRIVRGP